MEQKGFHRKLTAIFSADVAGYSRLMQDDEAATVKTLETYKQIIQHVPGQKAILTSGYSDIENLNQAMDLGISQFIQKPYSLHELAQALKSEISSN